jgi:prepilin-type N-terminal cleavage/methylation domain-containing protein
MDNNVLARRGFSLLELVLVVAAALIFMAASFYCVGKIRHVAFSQRVSNELDTIASAALEYYRQNGAWPVNLSGLRPGYLGAQSGDLNPFGNVYIITPGVSRVSVSTLLPKGLITGKSFGSEVTVINQGNNDLVSVTKPLESGIWSLKYDKKNVYKQ